MVRFSRSMMGRKRVQWNAIDPAGPPMESQNGGSSDRGIDRTPCRSPGVRHRTFYARAPNLQNVSHLRMESFAVTCPLAPDTSHLRSGSCTSSRVFGSGFLQTPPHGVALAFLLAFGSAITWQEDFHLFSSVPCPAHTSALRRVRLRTPPAALCSAYLHTFAFLAPSQKAKELNTPHITKPSANGHASRTCPAPIQKANTAKPPAAPSSMNTSKRSAPT
jgi:hypothetical protein